MTEKRSLETAAKRVLEGALWSGVSWVLVFLVKESPVNPPPNMQFVKLIWGVASLATGALITYVRTSGKIVQDALDEVRKIGGETQALLGIYGVLGEAGDFFRTLSATRGEDRELSAYLTRRVVEHVWNIPQATAKLAYQVLGEALERASAWEGIHWENLEELGDEPLDPEGMLYFKKLQNHLEKQGKMRIIMLSRKTYRRITNVASLEVSDADRVVKLWEKTGKFVDCYYFDFDQIMSILDWKMFTPDERARLSKPRWPDCAIYNGRYFVAFNRSLGQGNPGPRGAEARSRKRGNIYGMIQVWTTNYSGTSVVNAESGVSVYARGARDLFDRLRERVRNGRGPGPEFFHVNEIYIAEVRERMRRT